MSYARPSGLPIVDAMTPAVLVLVGPVTRDEWKRQMADYIPGPYADALLNWWESTVDRPVALTDTVAELTGHPARSFETWTTDHAADFTG